MVTKAGQGLSKTIKRELALMPNSKDVVSIYKKMMLDAERTERAVKNRRPNELNAEKDSENYSLKENSRF